MKTGIYIHIPFCKSRCIYCGFYSSTLFGLQHDYAATLIKEMHLRRSEFNGLDSIDSPNSVDTIYIGGGTPSTLPLSDIQDILNSVSECFPGNPREVTIEVNPDDITPEFVGRLHSFGINRISMGIQTFDDSRLQFLHRRHTSSQAIDAVRIIKEAGIENISIDLMFGFPKQTLDEWAADVQTAISLSPTHISAYSLMYEEGTSLYRMMSEGKIAQIDDEASLSMYKYLMDTLETAGYEHYEISNFAKPGYRSVHNSSYWNNVPYLGIGASAHSYNISTRSWNIADIRQYIKAVNNQTLPSESETIDETTHYNDLVTTALRTSDGMDLDSISPALRQYALQCAGIHINNGLLKHADNHLKLTREGLFVSDMVMGDLIKI